METGYSFVDALASVLKFEGGKVDNPADPGGRTAYGITQNTYNGYRRSKKLPISDVFKITQAEVRDIYAQQYWNPLPVLPPITKYVLFDTAVQWGVRGSIKLLQQALGVEDDGIFGEQSKAALLKLTDVDAAVLLVVERIKFRAERVKEKSSQIVFLEGWLNRDTDLLLRIV